MERIELSDIYEEIDFFDALELQAIQNNLDEASTLNSGDDHYADFDARTCCFDDEFEQNANFGQDLDIFDSERLFQVGQNVQIPSHEFYNLQTQI
jgi:hypothetical protein